MVRSIGFNPMNQKGHEMDKLFAAARLGLIALVVLLLGGCATGVGVAKHNIQTNPEYNKTVLVDVQNAKLLAAPTDDILALKCWDYIEAFTLANAPGAVTSAGEVVGVLSAYQKARNLRRTIGEAEISDRLRLECAPMILDSVEVMGRLGIRLLF